MVNIIYMHSKDLAPAVLAKRITRLIADAALIATDPQVSVRASKVDFERNFTGNWTEWAEGICQRRNATTRKFVYDIMVTDMEVFGKATTDALRAALLPGGQARVSVTGSGVKIETPILVYHWTPAPDRKAEPEEGFDFGKFRKLSLEDIVVVDEEDYQCTAMLRDLTAAEEEPNDRS